MSVFAVGALALALWLVARADWGSAQSPSESATPPQSAPALDATADGVAPVLTRLPPTDIAEAPLPPVDTPLVDTFDELAARADQGDYRAACRLALELHVCNVDMPRLEVFSRSAELQMGVDPSQVADNQLEQWEAGLAHVQAQLDLFDATTTHCRGAPEVSLQRRLGWWRQAAVAGSRGAVQEIINGEALPFQEWLSNTDHLAWMNRELEPLAWRAMRAGDLETAWNLMNALMPQPGMMRVDLLSQAVETDGEMSLAMAVYLQEASATATGNPDAIEAFRRWAQSTQGQLEETLPPEAQARAHAMGHEWRRSIKPLPVTSSPFRRYQAGPEALDWRRARMELCAEPGM